MNDTVFRISMEDDQLYYAATSEDEAYKKFEPTFGVPRRLLTFTKMRTADVPAGEEIL